MGQLLCIGILGGAGIGLAYVVPIAVGMKWFPDKKGLISGIAVAGFGFGATIWVKVGGSWFGLVANHGVQSVFLYYGIAFLIMVLIGSKWMVNPPAGYVPAGYTPPEAKQGGAPQVTVSDCTWQTMLNRVSFWTIWLIFVVSGMAGLMVIGSIQIFGIDSLQQGGMTQAAAAAAAGTAMAWYAIFNGLGRIAWGKVSDSIGAKKAIFAMTLLQGILMLTFYSMGSNPLLLTLYACAIGFNFGGNFALFPVSCAELFGTKNVGSNYPFVFTAYGIGGIAGPMLAGFVRDTTGNFLLAFVPAGIACLVGAALALTIRQPKPDLVLAAEK
jgi:MFS family permease